ncbi:hypothetical protein [Mycobacterium sp. MS1601]|nr:hypothetical protein [Mycobacterium sp. MS1601]
MRATAEPLITITDSSQLWKCSGMAAPGGNAVMPLRKSLAPT